MVFARLLVLFIFLIMAVIILNVLVPYMSPKYPYWWMFKRDRKDAARRRLVDAQTDVEVHRIEKKADTLKSKINKEKDADDVG